MSSLSLMTTIWLKSSASGSSVQYFSNRNLVLGQLPGNTEKFKPAMSILLWESLRTPQIPHCWLWTFKFQPELCQNNIISQLAISSRGNPKPVWYKQYFPLQTTFHPQDQMSVSSFFPPFIPSHIQIFRVQYVQGGREHYWEHLLQKCSWAAGELQVHQLC